MTRASILTAAAMRAAEATAIAGGMTADEMMERAATGVVESVRECAANTGSRDVLILCGPGNNGGDGYRAAAMLADEWGWQVRVAASAPPATDAARRARETWTGPVEPIAGAAPTRTLVDALFGTGLSRPLDPPLGDALNRLARAAACAIAVDLPSGVDADTGALLSPVPTFARTTALGALKPAHLLQPAASRMGLIDVVDIGVPVASDCAVLERPRLTRPGAADHKYTRGLVVIVAGEMTGAAALAALGAAHSGAGYVRLLVREPIAGLPHAVVQRRCADAAALAAALDDPRIGAVVIGPGLGHDDAARAAVAAALGCGRPLVLDAGALADLDLPPGRAAILTPHEGEFARAFGAMDQAAFGGGKLGRAREAARRAGATVLLKGGDTVVAAPDGRARIAWGLPAALATAGTGDVLAGICGTMLAQIGDPFGAASAAVWLHGKTARSIPQPFVADDLAGTMLSQSVSRCW